jgi:GT2 family glycosyltransferase
MRVSVAIATYQRGAQLRDLLGDLAEQGPGIALEACVVDDGSSPERAPALEGLKLPYPVRFARQENRGAAAARNHAARLATGEVLIFLDDDMRVGPDFVAQHLRAHAEGPVVALGRMVQGGRHARPLPLFERWHAYQIDRMGESFARGERPRGIHLYTGNVSLRRKDFFAAGGFDEALPNAEDSELGLRLEAMGVPFTFAAEAVSRHDSDHASLEAWRARAHRYGGCNRVLAREHPTLRDANPWRLADEAHPVLLPVIGASVLAPRFGARLAGPAYAAASLLAALGLEKVAHHGVTAAFSAEFFAGLAESSGGPGEALRELRDFAERFARRPLVKALARRRSVLRPAW